MRLQARRLALCDPTHAAFARPSSTLHNVERDGQTEVEDICPRSLGRPATPAKQFLDDRGCAGFGLGLA